MKLLLLFLFLVAICHARKIEGNSLLGRIRRAEPRCGLPSFTDSLPEEQREKVIDIWDDYTEGEDCENKRKETKQILAALDPEVRKRVLKPRGPAFLKGASSSVRIEFEQLWKDQDIPRREKPERFRELAKKLLNPIQLKEFNKFHAQMMKRRDDFQNKLSELSPEARAAHEKLTDLREQRHRIYMEATESVREELSKLYSHMEREEAKERDGRRRRQ